MRVLFWSETFWPRIGGVERLAAGLLPALRERGHELAVVTWCEGDATDPGVFEGIPVHRFPFFSGAERDGARQALAHLDEVRGLKRRFRPDLVHVNSIGRSAWFHLATHARNAPTLVTLHQPVADAIDVRESVAGRLLEGAAWIACCSSAVLKSLQDQLPSTLARSSVIANALPAIDDDPCPLSLDPPRLLFVGRLVPEKGLDGLIGALRPLFARFPRARLVVAGDGPLAPVLRAQVDGAGLSGSVQFLGWIDGNAVREQFTEASIVIVPSRVEGFGLVALEAAAMARPVVATRVGGLPEVVVHEQTGLLVEAGDVSGFVRAVERLLGDESTARRLGAAGRERAVRCFDWQPHVTAYDSLYRRLAA